MGVFPDRFDPRRASNSTLLGAAAGIAGIVVMIAVETLTGVTGSMPVVRYEPPPEKQAGIAANPELAFMVTPNVTELEEAFRTFDYSLDEVRKSGKPVPRLRLVSLPSGMADLKDADRRKAVFLALILPMILEANSQIAVERRRLIYIASMIESGRSLAPNLQTWLERLAGRYKSKVDRLDVLMKRVDILPVSLAMAQGAIESGWGTSRFAVQGNAIFGQWTTAGGRGMAPEQREEGMTHKVRAFDRLSESVAAYILNLNTHRAYRDLRTLRQQSRRQGMQPDGVTLAAGLEPYSEKGPEYVEILRSIMRVNGLAPFDAAILGDGVIAFESGA